MYILHVSVYAVFVEIFLTIFTLDLLKRTVLTGLLPIIYDIHRNEIMFYFDKTI